MKLGDFVIGVVFLVLGILIVFFIRNIPIKILGGGILIILGLWLIWSSLKWRDKLAEEEYEKNHWQEIQREKEYDGFDENFRPQIEEKEFHRKSPEDKINKRVKIKI